MKTIGIVGASGKAGRFLVHEGLKKGYKIRVLLRDIKNLKFFMHYLHSNVEIIEGDFHSKEKLVELLTGCDIVINTLGEHKHNGNFYENTTISILSVMKDLKIEKYIGICTSNLNKVGDKKNILHKKMSSFIYKKNPHVMSDKENALKHLEKSEINWNLYRVPKIIEFSKSNKVNFHTNKIGGFIIHNKTLAKFMLDNIDKDIYHNNSIFIWS